MTLSHFADIVNVGTFLGCALFGLYLLVRPFASKVGALLVARYRSWRLRRTGAGDDTVVHICRSSDGLRMCDSVPGQFSMFTEVVGIVDGCVLCADCARVCSVELPILFNLYYRRHPTR